MNVMVYIGPSTASMTLCKPRHSFSHFIQSTILEKC